MADNDVLARVENLHADRTPFVLATVVRAERPTSAKPGDRALILPDGSMEGFVGGSCAASTVRVHGLRLLRTGESTLLRITPTATEETVSEGLVTVGNPCLSGGSLDIFLEAMLPPTLVYVVGEAPVARSLVEVGKALGHEVRQLGEGVGIALPADLTALIIASHGRDEEAMLTAALRAGVPYVGLVASRKRGSAVLASLDVTDEQRARVHTPAGLDIGARTAPEVALSVYTELIAERRHHELPTFDTRAPANAEAIDPVCGMTVGESALSVRDGETIRYFCGPGCLHAFADNPDRYRE
ncbi:MAG TPA: XdhC family protein [Pseudonocardiaceae bacterium]|jgi:xanthine dehydrogenase accessory factor